MVSDGPGWLPDGEGALGDVNVLDLTHYLTGPYCTKLLADYGTDVIKIKSPGGKGLCVRGER